MDEEDECDYNYRKGRRGERANLLSIAYLLSVAGAFHCENGDVFTYGNEYYFEHRSSSWAFHGRYRGGPGA